MTRTLMPIILAPLLSSACGAQTVVYQSDFQVPAGSAFPEWACSDGTCVTNVESPNKNRWFLGEFGGALVDPKGQTRVRQSVRLTVKNLPLHREATVSFDLLILKSWDGDNPHFGPDWWNLGVEGGPTLFHATFSNNFKTDAYDLSRQSYPRPNSLPQTGAVSKNTLGYQFYGDSIYRLTFTFPNRAKTLTLNFASDLFEGKGTDDESWGLGNVRVTVDSGRRYNTLE